MESREGRQFLESFYESHQALDKNRRRANCVAAVAALWVAAIAGPAAANTYFVATNGVNATGGTAGSIDAPWKTLNYAKQTMNPGDTLYIRGGTYHEVVTFNEVNQTIAGYQGETVIVDGQGDLPPDESTPMIRITANGIVLRDLAITNSMGRGVEVTSTGTVSGVLIDNVKVSNSWQQGVWIQHGDHVTVQNCEVSQSAQKYKQTGAEPWAVAITVHDSDYTMIRTCVVHENHGEGIGDYQADHTTIEDNVVWDNRALNIYLDNSTWSTVRRNIVYATDNTEFWRYLTTETPPRPSAGIVTSSETGGIPMSGNQTIANNFVYNTGLSFGVWTQGGVANPTYKDSTIAYNTFVSTRAGVGYGVRFYSQETSGNFFLNNIVYQAGGAIASGFPTGYLPTTGYTFSNNDWSTDPGTPFHNSVTDSLDDPTLPIESGAYPNSDWLKLPSASLVVNLAQSSLTVVDDYFGTARGSSPDMGANEYPTATASNMLTNHGFETTSGWTNFPGAGQTPGTNAHSGTSDLKISQDTGGNYTDVYQNVSVTPGATYQASVWSNTWSSPPDTSRGQMRLQWYNGSLPIGGPIDYNSPAGSVWAKVQAPGLEAPPNATTLRMTLRRSGTQTGNFYFDDAAVYRRNLLANAGFETLTSWTNFPGAGQTQGTNNQSGSYDIKISQDTGGNYTDVYQQVPVTPGSTYEASVWSNTWSPPPGDSRGQMRLQFYNGAAPLGSPTNVDSTVGNSWAQLLTSVTAPANATHLRMTLRRAAVGGQTGNFYFDSAKIR